MFSIKLFEEILYIAVQKSGSSIYKKNTFSSEYSFFLGKNKPCMILQTNQSNIWAKIGVVCATK